MLLSSRRIFLAGLASVALAGCGFEPVYRQGSAARNLKGSFTVNLIDSRVGFDLLERLETHLGEAGPNAPYALTVTLDIEEEGLAISTANATTRITVLGEASFSAIQQTDGQVLFEDTVNSITAYNTTSSTAGTSAAKRDAWQRLASSLADKVNERLAITSGDWMQ